MRRFWIVRIWGSVFGHALDERYSSRERAERWAYVSGEPLLTVVEAD